MSVSFTTGISRARVTNMHGMDNIVKQVRFTITATDGTNTVSSFFPVTLDYPEAENFTAFEELTRDQISTWVTNKVGQDQINALKAGLTSELKDLAVEDPDNPILRKVNLPD